MPEGTPEQGIALSIVIPAYNEAGSMRHVVKELDGFLGTGEPFSEIILVNNGSTDKSFSIAAELAEEVERLKVINIKENLGYGYGILQGLKMARGDIVGWMHADGQIDPADLIKMYQQIRNGNMDICKARRLYRTESFARKIQSIIYNTLFRVLFGGNLNDINGSPKLFKRMVLENLQIASFDWFVDPEVVIKALRKGLSIGEVEISWRSRVHGKSKANFKTSLEFFKNMLLFWIKGDATIKTEQARFRQPGPLNIVNNFELRNTKKSDGVETGVRRWRK